MDLFTYLMAKNGNNTSVHGDLFSYLLGKGQSQTQTISGVTIYIPNAKKLVSFMMTKESTQETTTGINKLNTTRASGYYSNNGINFTINNDKSITIVGKATGNARLNLISQNDSTNTVIMPAGTYTKSILTKNNEIVEGVRLQTRLNNSGGSETLGGSTSISSGTFEEDTKIFVRISIGTDTEVNDTFYPMIISGEYTIDNLPPSEEYTGGIPSPNPDYPQEVNTVKGYRNLFDKNDTAKILSAYMDGYEIVSYATNTTIYIPVELGKTYTVTKKYGSTKLSRATSNVLPNIGTPVSNFQQNLDNKFTYTIPNDANYLVIFVQGTADLNDGFTKEEILSGIQIVEGDQELPYVPYGNNYILYKQVGKNLFVKSSAIANKYLDVNGNLNDNSVWVVSDYIRVNPSETIYYKGLTATGVAPYSAYYDINKNFISSFKQQTGNRTLTIPNNVYYVRFSVNQSENYPDINTFQVELNPITDYEEGKETTTLIPLNNNEIVGIGDYKDELKVDKSGHVFINKKTSKVILNGSENWQYETSSLTPTPRTTIKLSYSLQILNTNYLSNYFIQNSPTSNKFVIYLLTRVFYLSLDNTISNILDSDTNNEKLQKIKTWLSTHNTEVYYVLATPNLIDLNTTVDLKLFKGVNNVSNSEDGYMTIEYR